MLNQLHNLYDMEISTDSALIARVPLFAALPPEAIATLAATLRSVTYTKGTILFHEGEPGDRFYIVLAGNIAIVKAVGTDDERVLGMRGAGEFVGEMSLLGNDGLRTATVRVYEDARVLELTRADFDGLLHRYPMLAYEMLRVLSTRLRNSHEYAIKDLHEKNQRLAQAYADLQAAQAQLIEQEALARELRLASELQVNMLPRVLPHLDGLDIGARMVAARMVGGDLYDAVALDDDRVVLAIGDVSGKGMPAALFMALISSLLRAEAERGETPEEALRCVNRQMLARNTNSMFVTVLFGILDRRDGAFSYARAGHELPLILDAKGDALPVEMRRGHPLGLFPSPAVDVQTLFVPPGGTLLLYTDGVNEATNAKQEEFGKERIELLARAAATSSAQALCDFLVEAVCEYHGDAPQHDDITLLAVCRP